MKDEVMDVVWEKWMANVKDLVLTDRKTIIMKELIVTFREW